MKDIRGQETARRALEIAAAGGHNLHDDRAAGCRQIAAGLVPAWNIAAAQSPEEMLEVSMIASVAGMIEGGRLSHPPALPRAASFDVACGDGGRWQTGTAGARFRSPIMACCSWMNCRSFRAACWSRCASRLKAGRITVARANSSCDLSGQCAAYYGDESLPLRLYGRCQPCLRQGAALRRWSISRRISGSVARSHRHDVLEVPALETLDMLGRAQGRRAECRYCCSVYANARAAPEGSFCGDECAISHQCRCHRRTASSILHPKAEDAAKALLEQATESFRLSMRGYTRVLRVARTIADLEGSGKSGAKHHIAEAVSFRHGPAHADVRRWLR